MIDVVNITKRYKKITAVNGVNMYLNKGETVGLLGPNGAGKSTTISMIATLIPPTVGDIRLNNESVIKHPAYLRSILGIVPQEIALYMDLSARENLEFFARMYRLSGKEKKKKVDEVLDIIGLKDRQHDLTKHFSGGMKRRLNIGAALLHDPELIIMDEPTVGIDPQSRNFILQTVKRLNEEKKITVLYTSHYMEEVEFLCDRIYIMDNGKIIASGTKEEIKNILSAEKTIVIKMESLNEEFVHVLNQEPTIRKVSVEHQTVSIIVPKKVNLFQKIFRFAENTNTVITSIDVQSPTLEDVFLHLTGKALRD
ncbi:MAG: ABC transporter ATP-binding protein [Bacillales bacterium]|nr:ABC transporter ATP-binding protein [Bacillales bacterium]